ncbi:MAG: hypothetical protein QF903_04725 [Planctomycetota bacterium]|nr:hypothetical protein [Planctomycetota bacterium]MDP6988762.1 hypothetical protein [Planctomycetota bacterium]
MELSSFMLDPGGFDPQDTTWATEKEVRVSQQATRTKVTGGDDPLDLCEAAERFGIEERELRQWVNLERIRGERAVRGGRVAVVVRPSEVRAFLALREREAARRRGARTAGPRPVAAGEADARATVPREATPAAEPAPRTDPGRESQSAPDPVPAPGPTSEPAVRSELPARRLEDLLAERDRRQRTEVALARSEARCEALERHLDDLRIELKATRGEKLALLSRTELLSASPEDASPPLPGRRWILAAGAVVVLGLGSALAMALIEADRVGRRADEIAGESQDWSQRARDLEQRADGLSAGMETLRGDVRAAELATLGVRRELVAAEGRAELERRAGESATAERERALLDLSAAREANANLTGANAAAIAERDSLARERDGLHAEITGLARERDANASERDAALRDLETARLLMGDVRRVQELVTGERDAALGELREARARLEGLTLESVTLAAERDLLAAELAERRAAPPVEAPADEADGADAVRSGALPERTEGGADLEAFDQPRATEPPTKSATGRAVGEFVWTRLLEGIEYIARRIGR